MMPVQTSTMMLAVLKHLRLVHPAHRTYDELFWWAVTMDKCGTADDLKASLRELKRRHLIRYDDPLGWVATA